MEDFLAGGLVIALLVVVVFVIAGVWKTFEKAGQPGWAAIVPIYNYYIMTKLAGKPGWWTILLCIPYLNFVFFIIIGIEIAKAFGKGSGFGVGLGILSFIFYPILGFGNAQYIGSNGINALQDDINAIGTNE